MTLDKQQMDAVVSNDTRIMAVAGPGSGKTLVLTERVRRLLCDGQDRSRIAVVTFTNAAADEIVSRLGGAKLGYVGTLHGFLLRMITEHKDLIQYGSVNVMDAGTAEMVFKRLCAEMDIKSSYAKLEDALLGQKKPINPILTKAYTDTMRQMGCVDYTLILLYGLKVARTILAAYDHLLVDEVQDSSPMDWAIYDALTIQNKFMVGDPDQSIYGFRGGDPSLMLKASKDYEMVKLEGNYRCGAEICACAQKMIERNSGRFLKNMVSLADEDSEVTLDVEGTSDEMFDLIAKDIAQNCAGLTCAVLSRTNLMADMAHSALIKRGIHVSDRPEKDSHEWSMAKLFVNAIAAPNDTITLAYITARYGEKSAHEAAEIMASASEFVKFPGPAFSISDAVHKIEREEFSKSTMDRILAIAERCDTVGEMAAAMISREPFQTVGGVAVSTIHSAKGMEWDVVYLPWFHQHVYATSSKTLEDDRRLVYVAVTRARRKVAILAISSETLSQFIGEFGGSK